MSRFFASRRDFSRRTLLRAAGIGSALLPAAALAQHALLRLPETEFDPAICRTSFGEPVVLPQKRALKLTWNATAICTVGVPVAQEKGYFAKHNLDVDLVNYAGSTDQLLEAISTAKADAGIGMALRWLKPLEGGFDVKIAAGIHGGCMRLFSAGNSGITKLEQLKGKAIGVTDLAAPDRNFFSIMLHQAGIDPNKDVEWRVFPGDVLPVALKKGEVQAFCQGDPLGWIARERDGLTEVANNLSGEFAHRTCCVLGVRGTLIRQEKASRRRPGPGPARGAGVGRHQSGRRGGDLRPLCQGAGRTARGHAAQPHPPSQPAGGRPARADRSLRRGAEAGRRVQAQHRHPEIRRASHRGRAHGLRGRAMTTVAEAAAECDRRGSRRWRAAGLPGLARRRRRTLARAGRAGAGLARCAGGRAHHDVGRHRPDVRRPPAHRLGERPAVGVDRAHRPGRALAGRAGARHRGLGDR